jgi:phosphoribosylaminoimidazole-succinocarboxamide synthase
MVEKGLVDIDTRDRMVSVALELFNFGQKAAKYGLLIPGTKFELGITEAGEIILVDEILTPDSARYWQTLYYLGKFEQELEPDNYDKKFLRLWFRAMAKIDY